MKVCTIIFEVMTAPANKAMNQQEFTEKYLEFHSELKPTVIGGQSVDLYKLFSAVQEQGGFNAVSRVIYLTGLLS
jgi:hypothetical protein